MASNYQIVRVMLLTFTLVGFVLGLVGTVLAFALGVNLFSITCLAMCTASTPLGFYASYKHHMLYLGKFSVLQLASIFYLGSLLSPLGFSVAPVCGLLYALARVQMNMILGGRHQTEPQPLDEPKLADESKLTRSIGLPDEPKLAEQLAASDASGADLPAQQ